MDSNPQLLKTIADPQTLRHWLAAVGERLKQTPSDRQLFLQHANLLRALGELERARAAFAAMPALPSPDPARERPLAILSGEPLNWTDAAGPAPFVQLNDFLSEDQKTRLWDFIRDPSGFHPAGVSHKESSSVDSAVRQAHVARSTSQIRGWFLPLIEHAVEHERVLPRLGLAPFTITERELQITGHGDGGFYQMHKDSGRKNAGRYLSYVYYFHRQPVRFGGGELFLYDQNDDDKASGPISFTRIAPIDNSVVLFPSDRWHAVGEVTMESSDPLDGRWTVNGWLHRTAETVAQPGA